MNCSNCQHDNPEGAKFCNACGAKLECVCPSCGQVNPPGSRFCNECGALLAGKQDVYEWRSFWSMIGCYAAFFRLGLSKREWNTNSDSAMFDNWAACQSSRTEFRGVRLAICNRAKNSGSEHLLAHGFQHPQGSRALLDGTVPPWSAYGGPWVPGREERRQMAPPSCALFRQRVHKGLADA
jgi:hypothetical protein